MACTFHGFSPESANNQNVCCSSQERFASRIPARDQWILHEAAGAMIPFLSQTILRSVSMFRSNIVHHYISRKPSLKIIDMAEGSKPKGKAPKKQIDFIVTTANPSDASSSKANKKRVRSVAALKSWPERRKKMFQDLESAGTGHGAFAIDQPVQEPAINTEDQQVSVAPPTRKWPERRVKNFQRTEEINTARAEFLIERPEQQAQWSQALPTTTVSGQGGYLSTPRVPPGFTDASPRFSTPYGPLPVRTTPPRDIQVKRNNSDENFTPAGSSISLYRSKESQLLSARRAGRPQFGDAIAYNFSDQNSRLSGESSKKKRMADGAEKDSLHGNGRMVLLTPPTSPQRDAARGRADPFNCYTVEWQPWFDQILHHSKFRLPPDQPLE